MRDIDRLLSGALRSQAETFAPNDLAAAEQRFLRGRRKRRFTWFGGATLATAAAVVAVAVFPGPELVKEERVRIAGRMTTVPVGEQPASIASTRTGVWVANSGDGTVSRIDPDTAEVVATIDVRGVPEELATDQFSARPTVWVFDSEARRIVEVQPETDTVGFHYTGEWPEGTHLDLAVKDETVWMADPATETVYIDNRGGPPPGQRAYLGPKVLFKEGLLPEGGGDVAVEDGDGEVWSYNGAAGTLTLLQGANGVLEPAQAPDVADVLTSDSGDLAVGGEAMWVSDDFGMVMRIDRETFEKSYIDLGGRHSDLSYGGGYLWALTADEADDGSATLRQIDPVTARVVGQEFALEGDPVDVSAEQDAVWVAHQDAGTVTRIDVAPPNETPAPDPSESTPVSEEDGQPSRGAEIFFAFTADDDIFLEYSDGTTKQLTLSPDVERNPAFGLTSIFFERHDHETDWVGIIEHDLLNGNDSIAAEGRDPAVSPGGDLAYIDGDPGNERLYIARRDDQGRLAPDHASLELGGQGLTGFGSLEWSEDGSVLYMQARDERPVTVQVQVADGVPRAEPFVLDGVTDQPQGAALIQPDNALVDSIEVASLCCREDERGRYPELAIGRVAFEEGGPRYEDVVGGVLKAAELDPDDVYVADMHELRYLGEDWEMFSGTRSWIVVGDPRHVLLVDETGKVIELAGAGSGSSVLDVPPDADFGSFDLNPTLEGALQ